MWMEISSEIDHLEKQGKNPFPIQMVNNGMPYILSANSVYVNIRTRLVTVSLFCTYT